MSKKTTKISIGLCLGLILGFQELNASALSASDFNILDGLAGLRPDLLLKITREIKDPRDKQNFWGMCTSTSWLSENLLFEEAEKGNTDALNKIKSRTPDETGRSPIHYASQKGYLSVLKFLLDNGADVNQKITADLVASPYDDDKGMTPLYFASFNNKLAVVEELIARGADVNFATKARVTPLYAASMQGHLSVVELLINHGTDVDYLDKKGRASLHFAAENGHLSVVELLINHGADVNLAAGDSGVLEHMFFARCGELIASIGAGEGMESNTLAQVVFGIDCQNQNVQRINLLCAVYEYSIDIGARVEILGIVPFITLAFAYIHTPCAHVGDRSCFFQPDAEGIDAVAARTGYIFVFV